MKDKIKELKERLDEKSKLWKRNGVTQHIIYIDDCFKEIDAILGVSEQ